MCMNTQVNIGALSLLSRFQEGAAGYSVRRVLRSGREEGGSKSYVRKVWEGGERGSVDLAQGLATLKLKPFSFTLLSSIGSVADSVKVKSH